MVIIRQYATQSVRHFPNAEILKSATRNPPLECDRLPRNEFEFCSKAKLLQLLSRRGKDLKTKINNFLRGSVHTFFVQTISGEAIKAALHTYMK